MILSFVKINQFKNFRRVYLKIIQSNFPDSFYLPLVVSLFGPDIPKLVLFIDGEDLYKNSGIKNWYYKSYIS